MLAQRQMSAEVQAHYFSFFFFGYLVASFVKQLILFCPPLCLQTMQPVPAPALVLSVRCHLLLITQGRDGPRPCSSCLSCGSWGLLQLCLLWFVVTAVLPARPVGAPNRCRPWWLARSPLLRLLVSAVWMFLFRHCSLSRWLLPLSTFLVSSSNHVHLITPVYSVKYISHCCCQQSAILPVLICQVSQRASNFLTLWCAHRTKQQCQWEYQVL